MKNLLVGVGLSTKKDSSEATKEALDKALKSLNNKKPTITYVFFTDKHDAYKVNDTLKNNLKNLEFVGGSCDTVYLNDEVTNEGVLVVSLYSEYMHVGVSSVDNASKNPYDAAKKVMMDSLKNIPIDKYVDPYVMFTRMKNSPVSWMVKIPSFYVTVFRRGIKLPNMGDEAEVIRGISDVIGLQVPIWGGSFGVEAMKVLRGEPYEIYMIHSGKVMKDGLIVIFNTTSLMYSYSIEHGCEPTNTCGFISKTSNNGYVVEEISNKNIIDWYAEVLKMKKEDVLKNVQLITQLNPIGAPNYLGDYTLRGGGIPAGKGLAYVIPLNEGWPVYLMKGRSENLLTASDKIKNQIQTYVRSKEAPAIALTNMCVTRQLVYQAEKTELKKELVKIRKALGNPVLVGFTCFGEIGAKPGRQTMFQNENLNVFVIYDKLMTQLKE
ncbi:MAG TPA: FIST N-terminal domain-containing protein [Candidatus Nanoarchaeia archaeon]|nr:FIST N-terminal domain-containing protein [Candidatus Nanoarchaeia archaeon]